MSGQRSITARWSYSNCHTTAAAGAVGFLKTFRQPADGQLSTRIRKKTLFWEINEVLLLFPAANMAARCARVMERAGSRDTRATPIFAWLNPSCFPYHRLIYSFIYKYIYIYFFLVGHIPAFRRCQTGQENAIYGFRVSHSLYIFIFVNLLKDFHAVYI